MLHIPHRSQGPGGPGAGTEAASTIFLPQPALGSSSADAHSCVDRFPWRGRPGGPQPSPLRQHCQFLPASVCRSEEQSPIGTYPGPGSRTGSPIKALFSTVIRTVQEGECGRPRGRVSPPGSALDRAAAHRAARSRANCTWPPR